MFIFLPAVVSTVVGGIIFRQIFGELDTSFMNSILSKFSIPPQQWTMKSSTGMLLMDIGSMALDRGKYAIFMAGLQNIPNELYESADIGEQTGRINFAYNIAFTAACHCFCGTY